MKRYTIIPHPISNRLTVIRDAQHPEIRGKLFAVGPGYSHEPGEDYAGNHRLEYSIDDTQATVDWLNERTAGYPNTALGMYS